MIVVTASGAVYDIKADELRRKSNDDPLRRDDEFRPGVLMNPPVIGHRMRIAYGSGGIAADGIETFRTTTRVVSITE